MVNLKKTVYLLTTCCVFAFTGCTNPTSTAGSASTYYDGVITGVETIDIDKRKQNSTVNAMIGTVVGGVTGNLINGHTGGTLAGMGLGYIAGQGFSLLADRTTGLRLTVDTENGNMIVDMPYSCSYKIGKKVRLVSESSRGYVLVEDSGRYITPQEDDPKKCPITSGSIDK